MVETVCLCFCWFTPLGSLHFTWFVHWLSFGAFKLSHALLVFDSLSSSLFGFVTVAVFRRRIECKQTETKKKNYRDMCVLFTTLHDTLLQKLWKIMLDLHITMLHSRLCFRTSALEIDYVFFFWILCYDSYTHRLFIWFILTKQFLLWLFFH